MRTANAITHDASSSIGVGEEWNFGGILALTTPWRPPQTAAVIEIVGTPTEENR
jgi:hypothetical protein